MNDQQHLEALLLEHADTLRPLLGPLWPVRPFKTEQFGPLTKYTLGQMPNGEWAMLHCLREPDRGAPHCHPCRMRSFGIKGSYLERVFKDGQTTDHLWGAGSSHVIEPDCIHLLLELPEGEVWTLVLAGPVVRQWEHYPDLLQVA